MKQLSCTNKLILTGTPIQNDMTELWSLLNLLMPQLFNKLEDFNSWFVIDDFFETNDKIASMAKKDEVLDTILKVSEWNYTFFKFITLILKLNQNFLFLYSDFNFL